MQGPSGFLVYLEALLRGKGCKFLPPLLHKLLWAGCLMKQHWCFNGSIDLLEINDMYIYTNNSLHVITL